MPTFQTPDLLEAHLLEQLRAGQWPAGHRLPTERELGDASGLGRAGVRRVLHRLKVRGLISQTVGSGTYVTEGAFALLGVVPGASQVQASAVSPAELMNARMVLEPAIIDMVVVNARAADFEGMWASCDRAEAATTLEDFEYWDGKLHELIAEAAHNAVILSVFRQMTQARNQAEWGQLKRRSVTPERRLEYQREHRALVEALVERDATRAREVCLAHLSRVRHNMMGY
jgi:DNA-binding FadR family transcriptional regulator